MKRVIIYLRTGHSIIVNISAEYTKAELIDRWVDDYCWDKGFCYTDYYVID